MRTIEITLPHHVHRLEILQSYEEHDISTPNFEELYSEEYDQPFVAEEDLPPPIPFSEAREQIQEAYDRGFDDGKQVTVATLTAEMQRLKSIQTNMETLVGNWHKEYISALSQFENFALTLAVQIAGEIIAEQVLTDSSIAMRQAKEAVALLHNASKLTVRINPAEYSALEEVKSELLNDSGQNPDISILADPTVERGGCVVDSPMGIIDAQITHQLRQIRENLQSVHGSEAS